MTLSGFWGGGASAVADASGGGDGGVGSIVGGGESCESIYQVGNKKCTQ